MFETFNNNVQAELDLSELADRDHADENRELLPKTGDISHSQTKTTMIESSDIKFCGSERC